MLEHLDDPGGFTPDDGFKAAVARRGRHLRRRRRLAMAGGSLVVILLAGIGGFAALAAYRWDQVDRVTIHVAGDGLGDDLDTPTTTTTVAPGAATSGGLAPSTTEDPAAGLDRMTILIVGSDKRTGDEADVVSGQRADTLALVSIDPVDLDATVLSLPRDLWVPIAGTDHSGRINSALAEGPAALVATVEAFTGERVDHYVEIGFDGFRELVDIAGGIDVAFPTPARDKNTGLLVADAGCVHLDGEMALAYVRSRHYEEFVDGRWRTDPRSDLGRIDRQQAFGRSAMSALGGIGSGPRDLERLTSLLADHATIDDQLDLSTLRKLVGFARALDPSDITSAVVATTPTTIGGADVLLPVAATTTTSTTTPASTTTVAQGAPGTDHDVPPPAAATTVPVATSAAPPPVACP